MWDWVIGHGSNVFHSRGHAFSLELGSLSVLWKVTVLAFVHHGLGVSLWCYRTASIFFFQVAPSWCLTSLLFDLSCFGTWFRFFVFGQ